MMRMMVGEQFGSGDFKVHTCMVRLRLGSLSEGAL